MTIENSLYGPGWKKCTRCGLTAPDMIGDPPRCSSQTRCDHVKKGESLGGPDWTRRAAPVASDTTTAPLKNGHANGTHK